MRILKPPQLSRAFGRTLAGALSGPFAVTTAFPAGRCAVVAVEGDLDLATVATFAEAVENMLGTGARGLVVDLSAVPFCSGDGRRTLYRLRRRAGEAGVPVAWVVRTPAMRRLLEGTGADGSACYRELADALAAVG